MLKRTWPAVPLESVSGLGILFYINFSHNASAHILAASGFTDFVYTLPCIQTLISLLLT